MDVELSKIIYEVHQKPQFERYECTLIKNNTNCYSHAIGSTAGYIEKYRIGALCKSKPIDQEYFSVDEIKKILFSDCEAIGLKIEETNFDEELKENEYKVMLFVKIYADNKIHDYHFWRSEDGKVWTEKWRWRSMQVKDYQKDFLRYFPWNYVGMYKISR